MQILCSWSSPGSTVTHAITTCTHLSSRTPASSSKPSAAHDSGTAYSGATYVSTYRASALTLASISRGLQNCLCAGTVTRPATCTKAHAFRSHAVGPCAVRLRCRLCTSTSAAQAQAVQAQALQEYKRCSSRSLSAEERWGRAAGLRQLVVQSLEGLGLGHFVQGRRPRIRPGPRRANSTYVRAARTSCASLSAGRHASRHGYVCMRQCVQCACQRMPTLVSSGRQLCQQDRGELIRLAVRSRSQTAAWGPAVRTLPDACSGATDPLSWH